jgi:hypothetical protein
MVCSSCNKPNHNKTSCQWRINREALSIVRDDPNDLFLQQLPIFGPFSGPGIEKMAILLRLVQCGRLDHIVVKKETCSSVFEKYEKNIETGEITVSPSSLEEEFVYKELYKLQEVDLPREVDEFSRNLDTYRLSQITQASANELEDVPRLLDMALVRGRIKFERHQSRPPRERHQLVRVPQQNLPQQQRETLQQGLPQPQRAPQQAPQQAPQLARPTKKKTCPELSEKRDKVIETESCPICMDTMGETDITVLRCGHTFCSHCVLSHTLRCAMKLVDCSCPVCRGVYITPSSMRA